MRRKLESQVLKFLSNYANNRTTPRRRSDTICESIFLLHIKKCLPPPPFATLKKRQWSHEVLNGRANINCVISSSPTTGLRTIHLLRSILFRALPSHAIPADSKRCLHRRLNVKFGHNFASRRAQQRCHAVAACFPIAAEIPSGFREACRRCSLTQFNLPVVMSMMKHSWLKKSI